MATTTKKQATQDPRCPAGTSYRGVKIRCMLVAGHTGSHVCHASICWNPGNPSVNIPTEWHEASCRCKTCATLRQMKLIK